MTKDAYHDILAALCVWREARNQPSEAQRGVLWVIKNRAASNGRWPLTVAQVVLQPKQFSSFNADDPNAIKFPMPADASWLRVCNVLDDPGPDPTSGANHYHSVMPKPPAWSTGHTPTCVIGAFTFYRL